MDEHTQQPHLEDEHLRAALEESQLTVAELEQANAHSTAAAWFTSARTLRRFLAHPHCFTTPTRQ